VRRDAFAATGSAGVSADAIAVLMARSLSADADDPRNLAAGYPVR
jgi:hypothetical protein